VIDFNTPWEYDHNFRAIYDASGTTVTFLPTRHDPARARLLLASPRLLELLTIMVDRSRGLHVNQDVADHAAALIAEIEGGGT
jgi:hypothetical protein